MGHEGRGTTSNKQCPQQSSNSAFPGGPASWPRLTSCWSPLSPSAGPPHKASDFSILPTASASLRISTSSGTTVSKSVLIILLEGCHDNLQQAPRGGVSVCTGGRETEEESPRASGRERQRKGEDPGRTPVKAPNWTCSLRWPHPDGPIHAEMSSLSNLGFAVGCVAGRQGWSHREKYPGTPHSQDETQDTKLEWRQGDC